MMGAAKESWANIVQSERVTAYSSALPNLFFAQAQPCAIVRTVDGRSMARLFASSKNRYPSPDRPACSPSRPITVFRPSLSGIEVDIGYQQDFAMHLRADRFNWEATLTTTIGTRSCKRHQSSLQQWQCSVWPVALKVTRNVALRALAQASSLRKSSEQIAPEQCWQALPQACSATTQASTAVARVDNRAHSGRNTFLNRRRGHAPAAVLRFGDQR